MKFLKYGFIFIGTLFMVLVAIGIFKRDFDSKASVTIDAPVQQVFAVYNNPLLLNHWLAEFHSLENVSGSLNEVGSEWTMNYKSAEGNLIKMQHTLTSYVANQQISYDYANEWLTGQTTVTFEPADNNTTTVTMVQQYSGKGIVQNAILFLIQGSIEDVSQSNLESLKKLIERTEADEMNGEIDY
ncbi:SRPBCC family protein [Kangiella sp. M94]